MIKFNHKAKSAHKSLGLSDARVDELQAAFTEKVGAMKPPLTTSKVLEVVCAITKTEPERLFIAFCVGRKCERDTRAINSMAEMDGMIKALFASREKGIKRGKK